MSDHTPWLKVTYRGAHAVVIDRNDNDRVVFTSPLGSDREMTNFCLAWIYRDTPATAALYAPRRHGVAFTSKKGPTAGRHRIEWYDTPGDARAALAMMRPSHPDARMVAAGAEA